MSETEVHCGKLKPINTGYQFFDEEIDELRRMGFNITDVDYNIEWIESEELLYIDGVFYEILEHTYDDDSMISVNEDGSIDFFISFYNGTESFESAIDSVITNIRK